MRDTLIGTNGLILFYLGVTCTYCPSLATDSVIVKILCVLKYTGSGCTVQRKSKGLQYLRSQVQIPSQGRFSCGLHIPPCCTKGEEPWKQLLSMMILNCKNVVSRMM